MNGFMNAGRSGRQRWSFLAARMSARRGERVLLVVPEAESAWAAWIEFTKDAVVAHNDDRTHTTTLPGGGSVQISDVSNRLEDTVNEARTLNELEQAGIISRDECELYGADVFKRLQETTRPPVSK